jgi:hypothetical protein
MCQAREVGIFTTWLEDAQLCFHKYAGMKKGQARPRDLNSAPPDS